MRAAAPSSDAFPALRVGAPGRRAARRGSPPDLATDAARDAAVTSLVEGFHAASTRKSRAAMWATTLSFLDRWGLRPFPPSKETVVALGAALKAGSYASAENYLLLYRGRCLDADFPYSPALQRLHQDVVRSCQRGAGAPTKALGLPLLRLFELDVSIDAPWVAGGPVGPACAVIAGAWFMAREVELATTRASLVSLEQNDEGDSVVKWYLPASKTDAEARGVARAHGCCCSAASPASCPFHAVEAQLARLRRLFPDRWSVDGPAADLPLFPAADGTVVTKEAMVQTIIEAARRLGVPLRSPDSSARVSGHSLRVSGAQGLAKAGVDSWAIQLLGRWGSSAVLGYIREVPLELSATWATRAARSRTLEEVLRQRSRGSEEGALAVAAASGPSSSSTPRSAPLAVTAALAGPLAEAVAAEAVAELLVSDCSFVASPSGKWHRLSHQTGLGNHAAGYTAACGWSYTGPSSAIVSVLPIALCHKWFCARCFTEHRANLKARP